MASDIEPPKYDWEAEREQNDIPLTTINADILSPLGIPNCISKLWLRNPGDQHYVNKVFKLELEEGEPLILKLSHPLWNLTGKSLAEVRALKYVASLGIPCPTVLGFYSPIDPEIVNLDDDQRGVRRVTSIQPSQSEWILMTFIQGENLAHFWEDCNWSERKEWIEVVVGHLSKLSRRTFPSAGTCYGDDMDQVSPFISSEIPGRPPECFQFWNQKYLCMLDETIQVVKDLPSSESKLLKIRMLKDNLQQPPFKDIPIVFCLNDVAPKNILVDRSKKEVLGFFDMEWAGPHFLGKDIAEMDYPLKEDEDRNSNESFTDSREVPYSLQSEFVHEAWKKVGVVSPCHQLREKFSKVVEDLYFFFVRNEDQDKSVDKQNEIEASLLAAIDETVTLY